MQRGVKSTWFQQDPKWIVCNNSFSCPEPQPTAVPGGLGHFIISLTSEPHGGLQSQGTPLFSGSGLLIWFTWEAHLENLCEGRGRQRGRSGCFLNPPPSRGFLRRWIVYAAIGTLRCCWWEDDLAQPLGRTCHVIQGRRKCKTNPEIPFLVICPRAAILKPFGLRTPFHSEILFRTPNNFCLDGLYRLIFTILEIKPKNSKTY